MKKARYIYFPLIFGVMYALIFLMSGDYVEGIWGFIIGSLLGFSILFYNDYKIGKVASKDNKEAYNVRPKKSVVIFTNYDKAFDLCLDSVGVLRRGKVKLNNKDKGIITAKTGMNWSIFGNKITFKVTKLTNVTTQVEIKSEPIPRTALVDYGEGWKAVEDVCDFLDEKNQEMNLRHLNEKKDIPADFYTKASNKKKVSAK